MRLLRSLPGALILALAGCANPAATKLNADLAQCKATYPPALGSYHKLFQCFYDAKASSGLLNEGQMAIAANDLALADKVDAGQITKDEARADAIAYAHSIADEDAAVQAQQAEATAARLNAAAAIMNAFKPPPPTPVYIQPPVLPRTVTTNCEQNGNMTNCQSY